MSFRNRLTLFFIVIVLGPMFAVGFVLVRLVADAERSQDDARLSQAVQAATGLFTEFQFRARDAGAVIGRDRRLATALVRGDRTTAQERLATLARRTRAVRVVLTYDGRTVRHGSEDAMAPQRRPLVDERNREVGSITVSVIRARTFVALLRRTTNLEVALDAPIAGRFSTRGEFPDIRRRQGDDPGQARLDGRAYRYIGIRLPGFNPTESVSVLLLSDDETTESRIDEEMAAVGGGVAIFLILAFAFAVLVSRSLQAEIQRLLLAVRRLGGGDFAAKVPVDGHDEFAALGREFNAMAGQLETRLEELQTERARLQDAIRRIGESLGSNLDRQALLELTVQTAADGLGAACGRATVQEDDDGPQREVARVGDLVAHAEAITAAEAEALDAGALAETHVGGVHALAQPLAGRRSRLGLVSVARAARGFTDGDRDLFAYLARQAGLSMENVALHETVQRQAVTDQLTGLANRRRFQLVVDDEIERFKRGGQEVGLIMLDIDNFKNVNDTWGHAQGDMVLREVARVLRESSREIDTPARLGGEEMAVVLAQTDLEGAFRFAERVRERIEELELPILDGDAGQTMRVTASFGATSLASMPDPSADVLVHAVDQALYEAKRSGKNRTVRAA